MKGRKFKFEAGRLYYVRFTDHHLGETTPDHCEISGWFVEYEGPLCVFHFWRTFIGGKSDKDNAEFIKLVESAITHSVELPLPYDLI